MNEVGICEKQAMARGEFELDYVLHSLVITYHVAIVNKLPDWGNTSECLQIQAQVLSASIVGVGGVQWKTFGQQDQGLQHLCSFY